jgi:hypothetical protein
MTLNPTKPSARISITERERNHWALNYRPYSEEFKLNVTIVKAKIQSGRYIEYLQLEYPDEESKTDNEKFEIIKKALRISQSQNPGSSPVSLVVSITGEKSGRRFCEPINVLIYRRHDFYTKWLNVFLFD